MTIQLTRQMPFVRRRSPLRDRMQFAEAAGRQSSAIDAVFHERCGDAARTRRR